MGNLAGSCKQAPATKLPQVIEQLARLEDAVGRLITVATELEGKTTGVTRQEPSKTAEGKVAGTLVPVAESIRTAVDRIEAATDHIVDLIRRCEL